MYNKHQRSSLNPGKRDDWRKEERSQRKSRKTEGKYYMEKERKQLERRVGITVRTPENVEWD